MSGDLAPTEATKTSTEATRQTRRRFDRNASLYDPMEYLMETRAFRRWRPRLWELVEEERVLEVGVGTGKNMPYYPAHAHVTGIDLSPRMLERAKERAASLGRTPALMEMDVQHLDFSDDSFDAAVSTCVFCSVPDPVLGLKEIRRVLGPGGRLYMLEHVLSHKPVLRRVMNLMNPLVVRVVGANINRQTRNSLAEVGFDVFVEESLWLDIFWLFIAEAS